MAEGRSGGAGRSGAGRRFTARALVDGSAAGAALVLAEPLSFWGGLDAGTGRITDRRHPQAGRRVSGRVLVMPYGRGSSSSSSVLAEALRRGTGPAGIMLREPDPIVALGAMVVEELYGSAHPVVVIGDEGYAAIADGAEVRIEEGGAVVVGG